MNRLLNLMLCTLVFGLLIALRLSGPDTLEIMLTSGNGTEPSDARYNFGEDLRRGDTIKTADSMLLLSLGTDYATSIDVYLAQNTQITLDRIFENEVRLKLIKGRVVVNQKSEIPLTLTTNFTSHRVSKGKVSFINYDFLETVHVIPFGTEVTSLYGDGKWNVSSPLSIHETEPISAKQIEVNLQSATTKDFYDWVESLTKKL